jgi:hypothetical protein
MHQLACRLAAVRQSTPSTDTVQMPQRKPFCPVGDATDAAKETAAAEFIPKSGQHEVGAEMEQHPLTA